MGVTTQVRIISKKFKRKGRRENTRGGPRDKKEMITSCEKQYWKLKEKNLIKFNALKLTMV
jgi:hypothetical protein